MTDGFGSSVGCPVSVGSAEPEVVSSVVPGVSVDVSVVMEASLLPGIVSQARTPAVIIKSTPPSTKALEPSGP